MKAKYINEIFKEDSDPIDDLGIGMDQYVKREAKKIAEKNDLTQYLNRWEDIVWLCAIENRVDLIKYLVEKKGISAREWDDWALIMAARHNHTETVDYLLSIGAYERANLINMGIGRKMYNYINDYIKQNKK